MTMPTIDKNNVKFESYAAKEFSAFVVYLVLESLTVPFPTAKNNPTILSTSTLEQHLPCSYCMIVERDCPDPLHFDTYTGADCMGRFVKKSRETCRIFFSP